MKNGSFDMLAQESRIALGVTLIVTDRNMFCFLEKKIFKLIPIISNACEVSKSDELTVKFISFLNRFAVSLIE